MIRLSALALALGLFLLPGCGALLAPVIDDLLNDDQSGDQVPDGTPIGAAADLLIAMGGRACCDPALGPDQRVTVLTLRHVGPLGSDPLEFRFVPETDTKLFAVPVTGKISRGEQQSIEIFASDCDFEFQEFRMRLFFEGDEGQVGRSTTSILTVTNVCDEATPAVATLQALAGAEPVSPAFIDAIHLLEFDEPVAHGDIDVPDRIPSQPLSQISYHAMLRLPFDAMRLDELFTGAGATYAVGDHAEGTVFDAETADPMAPGDYLVGVLAVDGTFPLLNTTREWRFGFCFDSDGDPANDYDPPAQTANDPARGTDRWYFLDFAPGSGWTLRLIGSDSVERASAVRVIRYGNALLFVIPASEVPGPNAGYRVLTFTHTGDFGLGEDHDWSGDHDPVDTLVPVPE